MSDTRPYVDPSPPQDNIWWKLVNLQPATWRGLVIAVFALLAAVGIKVAPQIPDASFLAIIALLPIIQGLWTKGSVTPNAKVAVRVPDPVNEPTAIEAGPAVISSEVPVMEVLEAAHVKGA